MKKDNNLLNKLWSLLVDENNHIDNVIKPYEEWSKPTWDIATWDSVLATVQEDEPVVQQVEDEPVVQQVETPDSDLLKRFKKLEGTWDEIPPKLPEKIKGSFFPPLTNHVYDIKEDIRDFIIREESIRGQYMRQTEAYEKPAYEVGIEEFYNLSNKQRRKQNG